MLVDVLRAQAVNWVRREPRAWDPLGTVFVGVGVGPIGLSVQSKLGHNELKGKRMQENVAEEGNHAASDLHVTINARVARLAVGLEDNAGKHEAARDAHHPLGPPVNHFVGIVAALNRAEHTVVVEGIDVQVRASKANEHLNVEATWEEEDEHRNHDIQHEVGIAGEIKDQAAQQALGHESLHGRLRSDDGQHHFVRSVDGGNWFNQERDEECGRECLTGRRGPGLLATNSGSQLRPWHMHTGCLPTAAAWRRTQNDQRSFEGSPGEFHRMSSCAGQR